MQLRIPGAGRIPRGTTIAATRFTARARSINLRRIARASTAVAMFAEVARATPAAAQGVVGTVPGRVGGSVSALVALVGVVSGWLALRRSGRGIGAGDGRDGAIVALVLGLVGVFLAAVHLATSNGGVGSGSGKAGAMVAAVLGIVGVLLGRTALTRARRPTAD